MAQMTTESAPMGVCDRKSGYARRDAKWNETYHHDSLDKRICYMKVREVLEVAAAINRTHRRNCIAPLRSSLCGYMRYNSAASTIGTYWSFRPTIAAAECMGGEEVDRRGGDAPI